MIVNLIFRKILSKFARKEVDQEFPDRDGSVLSSIFVDFTRARSSEQIGGVPGRAVIVVVAIALACALAIGGIGIAAADGSAEWEGKIEIEADPVEHGDSFEYEMGSVAEVDNVSLLLEGFKNSKEVEETQYLQDDSVIDIGGTKTISADIELSGKTHVESRSYETEVSDETQPIDGNLDTTAEVSIDESAGEFASTRQHDSDEGLRDEKVTDIDVSDGQTVHDPTFKMWSKTEDSSWGGQPELEVRTQDGDIVADLGDPSYSTGLNSQEWIEYTYEGVSFDVSDYETLELWDTESRGNDWRLDWFTFSGDQITAVDIESSADSDTISPGESTTIEVKPGDKLDINPDFPVDVPISVDYDAQFKTEDPSITINDKTISHDGFLAEGESVEKQMPVDPGTNTIEVKTGDDSKVEFNAEYTEITEPKNPTIALNGHSVGYDGTLSAGETADLSNKFSSNWIQEGTNVLELSIDEVDGPNGIVGVDYQHAAIDNQSIDYKAEQFTERHDLYKEWQQDTQNAELSVPLSDRVIDIRDYELLIDGQTSDKDVYLESNTLVAELGDMDAGQTASLVANATKVDVKQGEMRVIDPTIEGQTLDSRIEVLETGSDGLHMDFQHTIDGDKLHYVSSATWDNYETSYISSGGENILQMPYAVESGEATLSNLPLIFEPETETTVELETTGFEDDSLRFNLLGGDGSELVDIHYQDAIAGDEYHLIDTQTNYVVDGQVADMNGVTLRTDNEEMSYMIEAIDVDTSGIVGTAPVFGGEDSGPDIPVPFMIGAAALVSMLGVGVIAHRSPRMSRRATVFAGTVTGVLGIVAIEVVTTRSIAGQLVDETLSIPQTVIDRSFDGIGSIMSWFGDLLSAGLTGAGALFADLLVAGAASGILPLIVAIGLFIVLAVFQDRTEVEVPVPVLVASGGLVLVWFLEVLAPGMMVSALQSGLEEIGPLVWLVILAGGALSVIVWLRSRGEPDEEVTLEIGDT